MYLLIDSFDILEDLVTYSYILIRYGGRHRYGT